MRKLYRDRQDLDDFTHANYTAVISDLHLCEEEPVHKKFPLWKKYKTRRFFFDDQYFNFLKYIDKKTKGEQVELVLNGDIFDFDSVCAVPKSPPYKVDLLEKQSGLDAQQEKSCFKLSRILKHHPVWLEATRWFVMQGHRVIFVIGNHDLELHWPQVQLDLFKALDLPEGLEQNVRFNEWFYISNQDTLIEHGNQYDPYCMQIDPVNPFIKKFNRLEIRVPFGNLTTRYLINNMGFFNPHADSNYIMSMSEYVVFFFRYMFRAQPQLLLTWFTWSVLVWFRAFSENLFNPFKNPLAQEDKIEHIAKKSNATPRMVRELRELFVEPAVNKPILIAKELWLDRAFLVVIGFAVIFQMFLVIDQVYNFSFFWMFIPLVICIPFFLFYSRSIYSSVEEYKEPREKIMWAASIITKVQRIIYGHTHEVRHELIGPVEHLNSGTWSPAFLDVECEKPVDYKTYIWIEPGRRSDDARMASVYYFEGGKEIALFTSKGRKKVSVI